MIWQDLVFTGGRFVLALALVPALFARSKPPRVTCVLTAAILTAFSGAFLSLGLSISAAAIGLNALVWWLLLLQRRRG